MSPSLEALTSSAVAEAFRYRLELAAGPCDARLAGRTACLTMLAGSGSRWLASLEEARAAGRAPAFDPREPRGLFPVRNLLGFGPEPLPIAAYALAAARDLGSHVIVVRGWERAIEERVLRPIGYEPGSWAFATQDAPGGKPRGHGHAAFQSMPLWEGADYVVVNFAGDASSPVTALAALRAMDGLASSLGERAPALLLPAARVESPAYPVGLDEDGLPRSFGHAKLSGGAGTGCGASPSSASPGSASPGSAPSSAGYTNVGVRVYRARALREALLSMRERYWTAASGYALPGNAPATDEHGGEFALDNVDAFLAAEGRARILAVARPEELSPVKSLADLPRFERDMAAVAEDWRAPYSKSGSGLEKK